MKNEDLVVELVKKSSEDISDIKSDISVMKVEVKRNREDLEEHMKQTRAVKGLALDVRQEADEKIQAIRSQFNSDIAEINKKLSIGYLLKLIVTVAGGIATISGAIYGVIKLIEYLK